MSSSHYELVLCSLFIFSLREVTDNLQQIAGAFPQQAVDFLVKVARGVNSRDCLEPPWVKSYSLVKKT